MPVTNGEVVVDTTGAGDAYIGGFLASFYHGFSLLNCMRLGSLVAHEKILGHGSIDTLPSIDRVQLLLERWRNTNLEK